ncbi:MULTISPECIES: SDR family oxidoreductase [unclassified Streptomyces]|jgi:3-oxoacyl-[acyl-carrier protein] reductase|uniref:SDR family oxidoreductase n=1 Tax=Streptomyces sp. NPDC005955 TaxID=3364738 RepID=UPI0036AD32EF
MSAKALEGKIALVTGGSRGIGRAIAERLGRDGAVVAVGYARDERAADEVVARIEEGGGKAFALPSPLGRHGDAAALWASFDARVGAYAPDGGVDVIVNNAGIVHWTTDESALTEEQFDELFAVNVRAPYFIVQEAAGRLRDQGRVINISSGLARLASPEIKGYGATKGALDTLTLNLAKELGPRGITVNSVAPGVIETDINAEWLASPDVEKYATEISALGRIGRPDDVADVVAFLASNDARWVTGRVVDVTGGSGL